MYIQPNPSIETKLFSFTFSFAEICSCPRCFGTYVGIWFPVTPALGDAPPRKAEMEETLAKLQSFCAPGGRAESLGCNIQTISYTNGPRDKKVFGHLNQYITQAHWQEHLGTGKMVLVSHSHYLIMRMGILG